MSPKPIPIAAAEDIAKTFGFDQVIIIARAIDKPGRTGLEHVTTYGANKAHCDAAAKIGDFLKYRVMQWEKEISNVKS